MHTNPQIIVALDVASETEVDPVLNRLPQSISWYKVGLELFTSAGPSVVSHIHAAGKKIFLDLKLHDIPRTVAKAVSSASGLGVSMLTIHASGGKAMIAAAAEAAKSRSGCDVKIIAVTMLTSLDEADLKMIGVNGSALDHTLRLAELAVNAGADGLVCSPKEAAILRERLGPGPLLITPGIRPAGAELGDQKRVATPADAVRSGASFLVIGRPILEAANPSDAVESILKEIAGA